MCAGAREPEESGGVNCYLIPVTDDNTLETIVTYPYKAGLTVIFFLPGGYKGNIVHNSLSHVLLVYSPLHCYTLVQSIYRVVCKLN